MSSAIPSAKNSCSGSLAHVGERQAPRSTACRAAAVAPARRGCRPAQPRQADADAMGAHRPGDILNLLLAHVLEREGELVPHLIAHHAANADTARLRQGFEPSSDVDAVAEDVVPVDDDVAEIDADAKLDPRSTGTLGIALGHRRCTSTAQRTASTTLANSTNSPSPVVLTMRPRCSAIIGSTNSRRIALNAAAYLPRRRPSAANIRRHQRRGWPQDAARPALRSNVPPRDAHGNPGATQ